MTNDNNNFALDQKDLATDQFVNQISHMAKSMNTETVTTQTSYRISDVQLVNTFDKKKLGTPLSSIGLKLRADVIGYESAPGRYAKLVDMDVAHHDDGQRRPRKNGIEMIYQLNTPELVRMFDGGLNDYPQAYTQRLRQRLLGTEFSRPDNVQITKLSFESPQDSTGELSNRGFAQGNRYDLYAVNPNPSEHQFDSRAKDNSFTFGLNQAIEDAVEAYQHPKEYAKTHPKAKQLSETKVDLNLTPSQLAEQKAMDSHNQSAYDDEVKASSNVKNATGNQSAKLERQDELNLDQLVNQLNDDEDESWREDDNNLNQSKVHVDDELSFDDDEPKSKPKTPVDDGPDF